MSKEIIKKVLIETQTEQDDFFSELIDELRDKKQEHSDFYYVNGFVVKIDLKITLLKIENL